MYSSLELVLALSIDVTPLCLASTLESHNIWSQTTDKALKGEDSPKYLKPTGYEDESGAWFTSQASPRNILSGPQSGKFHTIPRSLRLSTAGPASSWKALLLCSSFPSFWVLEVAIVLVLSWAPSIIWSILPVYWLALEKAPKQMAP